MKILALEKETSTATGELFAKYARAEAQKAWELQQAGFIREIYFREDQNSAVIVLEAESVEEAQNQLQQLPLVKNNLIEFELIP